MKIITAFKTNLVINKVNMNNNQFLNSSQFQRSCNSDESTATFWEIVRFLILLKITILNFNLKFFERLTK